MTSALVDQRQRRVSRQVSADVGKRIIKEDLHCSINSNHDLIERRKEEYCKLYCKVMSYSMLSGSRVDIKQLERP